MDRKFRKRRRFKKKPVKSVKQLERRVNRMFKEQRPELKLFESLGNAISYGQIPNIVLLNPLQLGDTASTRTGERVRVKGILLRYTTYLNDLNTASSMRMMVVRDNKPNATLVVLGDVLESTGILGTLSPLNHTNQGRFKVLYDKIYTQEVNSMSKFVYHSTWISVNHVAVYNTGSTGTIADIEQAAYYFISISNQGGINLPAIDYYCRLRYIDN